MGILRDRLLKSDARTRCAKAQSSICIDEAEIDMRNDIEEQSQAAAALQTYVHEMVAGFEALLLAHEKLRDGAMKELREVGQAMDAPLNNLGRAVRHMKDMASHTTVGLQVHQRKLTACRAELARTDKAAALLQSMGVTLKVDEDSGALDVDSNVSVRIRKGGRHQKREMEGGRLAKLIHTSKVQRAYARSTLEACVTRRESLVEIAQKSLAAVAKTVPQLDEVVATGIFDMTARSNSTTTSFMTDVGACDESWNPFAPDLTEVDQGTKRIDSTPLKRQVSDSTLDTTLSSGGLSQPDSDNNSSSTTTNPFAMSESPDEESAKAPANSVKPSRWSHALEEWANNPFTDDMAISEHAEHEEHIPNEEVVVQPIGKTHLAKLVEQTKSASMRSL